MLLNPPQHPARYSPDVDPREKGEDETGEQINKTMQSIRDKTFADGGHAIRSVHAKSHALLEAEMVVDADLPPQLAQGLFAKAGRYPVILRFSTIPGDILDDSVSTPRGLAVKIIGVEGERLEGSEADATQDFVLVNGPTFNAPNAKMFAANLKLLAATTDKIEGVKKVMSAAMRGLNTVLEGVGIENFTIQTLGGQPETHILGETFYSQASIRFGDYIAKVSVAPVSPQLTRLTDEPLNVNGKPDGLREACLDFFRENGGEWDVRIQLCTDLDDMPIDNLAKEWDSEKSPYLPVARITARPQTAWSPARSSVVDDQLAFTPWHGLAAHRPLGTVMRLRKAAYEQSARDRAQKNGKPVTEPREHTPLPA